MQVVVAHVVGTAFGRVVDEAGDFALLAGRFKHHHVQLVVGSEQAEAVGVGVGFQHVVAIYELHVLPAAHVQTRVSRATQSLIGLTDVENLVLIAIEMVEQADFRAVVNHNHFALAWLERQGENAFNTWHEQFA